DDPAYDPGEDLPKTTLQRSARVHRIAQTLVKDDENNSVHENNDSSSESTYKISHACSPKFYSVENKSLWYTMSKRKLHSGRIVKLLQQRSLLGTVTKAASFERIIVYEFYSNLSKSINLINFNKFGKVFIRSKIYRFLLIFINNFYESRNHKYVSPTDDFDVIISELTGGKLPQWPDLFDQVIVLFCIGTAYPLNIRKVIFYIVVKQAENSSTYSVLPFLSLIDKLLISQGYKKQPIKVLEPLRKEITHSKKLLDEHHVDSLKQKDKVKAPVYSARTRGNTSKLERLLQAYLELDLQDIRRLKCSISLKEKKIRSCWMP
ncbi:hypothetical protein Pfo_005217, partial [Paulownia fortunei]